MTLPEHVICSVMLAQFGMRQRFGWKGVVPVALAGIAPDIDTAAKLVNDREYWRLHHALGHGVLSVLLLSAIIALLARWLLGLRPRPLVWLWCLAAGAVPLLTDTLYVW